METPNTATFEELVREGLSQGYSPGFDLKTRERYMEKTQQGGNHNYETLRVRTFESNLIKYSVTLDNTVSAKFPLLPNVLFCNAEYFKKKKLQDEKGNNIPIAHIPFGTYCIINNEVFSITVKDINYCHSIQILDAKTPVPQVTGNTPGLTLNAPNRVLRKENRKYLQDEKALAKVSALIGVCDYERLINDITKYYSMANWEICLPSGTTLDEFLTSTLVHTVLTQQNNAGAIKDVINDSPKVPHSWYTIYSAVRRFLAQIGKEVTPYHVDSLHIIDK